MKTTGRKIILLALGLSALVTCAHAQRPGERLKGVEETAPLEGEAVDQFLQEFRHRRLSGDYIFDFELQHLPRRGETQRWHGRMWGTWTDQGPLSRVHVEPHAIDGQPLELLVLSGKTPIVWKLEDGKARRLTGDELHQPLFKDLIYTPYDLALPFAWWGEYTYQGTTRAKGFPAHVYHLTPPKDVAARYPKLESVEAVFHADYYALMKAQMLDSDGEAFRTFQILDFARVDEQYIVRTIDLIDEESGDKTRFEVAGAAIGANLPIDDFFTPDALEAGPAPHVDIAFRRF